ncbi:MAG: hypothetical protein L6V88_12390 [Anaerotruncus sp.]|nr:MAG: hypothetical protein L6V88_12390 [Anaerotruncus sp.]
MYEYKFDKMKPEGKSYPSAERVMHYYEKSQQRAAEGAYHKDGHKDYGPRAL